jgi:hypothetical protein
MKYLCSVLLFAILFTSLSYGELYLNSGCAISFATVEEGGKMLMVHDEFIERLSPFDRSSRLKTDREVSEKDYLDFVSQNVISWKEDEKEKISSAVKLIEPRLGRFSFAFPETIYFIKTTGKEEGNAAYTRGSNIILPEGQLAVDAPELAKLVCHELFHVLSRRNPQLFGQLYQAIGFEKCNEIKLPDTLAAKKITNPDAPGLDCRIRVRNDNAQVWAVPVLLSRSEKYDPAQGGEFFNYMQFKLLAVQQVADSKDFEIMSKDGKPVFLDVRQVSGYFEQIGNNTGYIIHPEEILADNLVLLVFENKDIPSPDILEKIYRVIVKNNVISADPNTPADKTTK